VIDGDVGGTVGVVAACSEVASGDDSVAVKSPRSGDAKSFSVGSALGQKDAFYRGHACLL
jgi:hypothetical protein